MLQEPPGHKLGGRRPVDAEGEGRRRAGKGQSPALGRVQPRREGSQRPQRQIEHGDGQRRDVAVVGRQLLGLVRVEEIKVRVAQHHRVGQKHHGEPRPRHSERPPLRGHKAAQRQHQRPEEQQRPQRRQAAGAVERLEAEELQVVGDDLARLPPAGEEFQQVGGAEGPGGHVLGEVGAGALEAAEHLPGEPEGGHRRGGCQRREARPQAAPAHRFPQRAGPQHHHRRQTCQGVEDAGALGDGQQRERAAHRRQVPQAGAGAAPCGEQGPAQQQSHHRLHHKAHLVILGVEGGEHQQKGSFAPHQQQVRPPAPAPAEVRQQGQRQAHVPEHLGVDHRRHGDPRGVKMQESREHLQPRRIVAEGGGALGCGGELVHAADLAGEQAPVGHIVKDGELYLAAEGHGQAHGQQQGKKRRPQPQRPRAPAQGEEGRRRGGGQQKEGQPLLLPRPGEQIGHQRDAGEHQGQGLGKGRTDGPGEQARQTRQQAQQRKVHQHRVPSGAQLFPAPLPFFMNVLFPRRGPAGRAAAAGSRWCPRRAGSRCPPSRPGRS